MDMNARKWRTSWAVQRKDPERTHLFCRWLKTSGLDNGGEESSFLDVKIVMNEDLQDEIVKLLPHLEIFRKDERDDNLEPAVKPSIMKQKKFFIIGDRI